MKKQKPDLTSWCRHGYRFPSPTFFSHPPSLQMYTDVISTYALMQCHPLTDSHRSRYHGGETLVLELYMTIVHAYWW